MQRVLDAQVEAWNRGDIDGFMKGYWESDSLQFIGRNGVTYGYRQVSENYRKNYRDTVIMGKLRFDILRMEKLARDHVFVTGRFTLVRTIGDASGYFTLVVRRIKGRWVVVSDHTSG